MKIKNKFLFAVGIVSVMVSIIFLVVIYFIDTVKIDKLLNGIASILEVLGALSLSLSLSLNIKVDSNNFNIDLDNSNNNQIYNSQRDLYVNNQQPTGEFITTLENISESLKEMRTENINSIIEKVKQEIQNEEIDYNLTMDRDFLLRYIEDGSSISDSDVQEIWAKLMTNNLKKHKSVSKATLSIVKDMQKEDAVLFEDITDCCIEEGSIFKCLTNNKFTFMQISTLKDLRLLKADSLTMRTITIQANSEGHINNCNLIIMIKNQNNFEIKIELEVDILTREGLELKNSLGKNISNNNLISLGKYIKEKYDNIIVTVNEIVAFNKDGTIVYKREDLLK